LSLITKEDAFAEGVARVRAALDAACAA
jgi:hypothetical protein